MRKLALAAFSYTAAVTAAHYILTADLTILFCGFSLIIALFCLFLREDLRTRLLIVFISSAVGFAWHFSYSKLVVDPCLALDGQTVHTYAIVLDYPASGEKSRHIDLMLYDDNLPRATVTVFDYSGLLPDLEPGDAISCELRLRSAVERYGSPNHSLSSRGIFLTGYLESEPQLVGRYALDFLFFPKTIAHGISASADSIFSADVRAYIKALLIGDTDELKSDSELDRALSISGIRHIAAVSGLHLSFIYGALLLLFGKKTAGIITIPAVFIFALISGLSPSVCRAAVMLSLFIAASMLGREPDGLTTLSAPLLLLLLINPYAIGSISLQLSFAAMAGVLLVAPKLFAFFDEKFKKPDGTEEKRNILRDYIFSGLASSIGASFFTVPLVALYFGHVSLVSVLTNLLTIWAVSLTFIGGYFAVILGAIFAPLAVPLVFIVSLLAKLTIGCAEFFSTLPNAAIYTANKLVIFWIFFSYAVIIVSYLLSKKRKLNPLYPCVLCLFALLAVFGVTKFLTSHTCTITVLDIGQGLCVVAMSPESTVVVDCGGNFSPENAGDTLSKFLLSRGRRRIDLLLLTHLHSDHADGVPRLLERIDVDNIYLDAETEDRDTVLSDILAGAKIQGSEVFYVNQDISVVAGNISADMYSPRNSGEADEAGVIIRLGIRDYDVLITGDAGMSVERRLISEVDLADTELLIVGHHGSKYSTSTELLEAINPELAIISVGWNSYGHPSEEALSRLDDCGIKVLQTDISGNISVRILE